MTKDVIITEVKSIVEFIDETKSRVDLDFSKFQVALSNTLRLIDGQSPTLAKLKGNHEDLKGYLVKTSTEMRESAIQPYHQLKIRMEKVLSLLQTA